MTFPIKKWSAAAALFAAAFYLLLSGAEVATQRSFYTTAVVLIAVMVDPAPSPSAPWQLAAMIVLLLAPEALVHPEFADVVCRNARTGASAGRHAAPVCDGRLIDGDEGGSVGAAGSW